MLEFDDVCVSFGAQPVLLNVAFMLPAGAKLAVMGPSGCGKTTLLRAAAGLVEPERGRIVRPEGGAAVVFQEPRLLPWLTAEENVNLVLSDRPSTLPEAREWLKKLGLSGAEGKYPHELSGGMQRRVAIARALAQQRELLILDEPFSALDSGLRESVLALLRAMDCSVLLATHEEGEAAALGCRVLRYDSGRFV